MPLTKALIRVDSSTRIGTGHLMRCLTLAEQLRAKECDVSFAARAHPGNINSVVSGKGFRLIELPAPPTTDTPIKDADYPAWLGVTQDQDAQETLAATGGQHFEWLVVDHYSLDAQWERQMRLKARKIMVIDDLANRPHDCDLILDCTVSPTQICPYDALIPFSAVRLFGVEFCLLRPQLLAAAMVRDAKANSKPRVLIYFGGSDLPNLTSVAIESLEASNRTNYDCLVVVGAKNPHRNIVMERARRAPTMVGLANPVNFDDLVVSCDFVIGGGGVFALERTVIGIPSLTVVVSENQRQTARILAQAGLPVWNSIPSIENLSKAFESLLVQGPYLRESLLRWLSCLRLRSPVPIMLELTSGNG